MSGKKYTYKVRPGRRFGPYREYGPGTTLELTPEEAEGFPDILAIVKDPGTPDEPIDHAAHLESLTVAQLTHLKEWDQVEPPKPTKKAEIIEAILEIRGAA
jgi:hypothetical protein